MKEMHVDIRRRLPGFTLQVQLSVSGRRLGLLGASGSGKSMTLRCIAGIDTPDEGVIVLNGRTLFDSKAGINLPARKRRVGYLFQNYALFPHLTVGDNICLALRCKTREEAGKIVRQQAELFQLEELLNRYPAQLSGGQQQRVALARVLANEPEALLLDEPFSALDSFLRWQLEPAMLDILTKFDGPILYVSHNRDETYRLCDDMAVLDGGRILRQDEKKALFSDPRHVSCARLTGCKNISAAKKTGEHTLQALEWGLSLTTMEVIPENLCAVGFRAHDFCPGSPGEANAFQLPVLHVSETPFSVTVLVGKPDAPLRWEIDRSVWQSMCAGPLPEWIILPPQRILLLTDEKTAR